MRFFSDWRRWTPARGGEPLAVMVEGEGTFRERSAVRLGSMGWLVGSALAIAGVGVGVGEALSMGMAVRREAVEMVGGRRGLFVGFGGIVG